MVMKTVRISRKVKNKSIISLYTLKKKMLVCINPIYGEIWTNPNVG